jgi:murein peptide amidase A
VNATGEEKPLEPRGSVSKLLVDLEEAARSAHFSIESFGSVEGFPLLAFQRTASAEGAPSIYLSAGIHGDEPAGTGSLLSLINRGAFGPWASWTICPLLNPAGLARGTRENADGIDLNRDYLQQTSSEVRAHLAWLKRQGSYDRAICLHEDWEAEGFYLYEINRDDRPSRSPAVIEAVRAVGPIDAAGSIDGRPASGGIIRPDQTEQLDLREDWAEAIHLACRHTRLCYTLETPSRFPLSERIRMMNTAGMACISDLLTTRGR